MSNKRDSQGTWYPDAIDLDEIGEPDPASGTDVVRYRDATEVGRGAMGRVYGVWDDSLGRRVAYKVMSRKVDSETARQRFFREARITARLEHPGIVPIYDLDHDLDGTPYYTMRFLEGQTLKDALVGCESLGQRLALLPRLLDVCQAMAYAHDRGVVHRDLKPANVLLGAFGETLVVDWGLAKALDDDELNDGSTSSTISSSDSTATRAGTVIGSPSYMSPEQASGELERVGTASDVWSLGVVLYQVLTGRRPFAGATADETLSAVRRGRYASIRSLEPDAPQELVAVCDRALQREITDRYPSAAELAHDLEAWLNGGLVRAYRYSTWERIGRFVETYRLPLGIVAVCGVVIAATGAFSLQRVLHERDRALAAEAEASRNLAEAYAGKAADALEAGKVLEAELFAAAALKMGERPDTRGILARTRTHWRPRIVGTVGPEQGCYDMGVRNNQLVCGSSDGTYLFALDGSDQPLWHVPTGKNLSVAIHPSDDLLAVLSDQHLYFMTLSTGEIRRQIKAFRKGNPPLAWHEDGEVLAYATSSTLHLIRKDGEPLCKRTDASGTVSDFIWEGDQLYHVELGGKLGSMRVDCTESPSENIESADGIHALARHPDGSTVVATTTNGLLQLDASGKLIKQLPDLDAPAHRMTFDPEGRHLFSLHEDGWVHITTLDAHPSTLSMPTHTSERGRLLFLDDRRALVSALGLQPQIWELPEERPGNTFGDAVSGQWNAAWSPSGRHLAVSTGAKVARVYEPMNGAAVKHELQVSNRVIRQVMFADERQLFVIDTWPKEVEVWDIEASAATAVFPIKGRRAAYDRTRGQLYLATTTPQMQRWDDLTGPTETWLANDEHQMWDVSVSDDGSTLAYSDADDDVWVFALPGRKPLYSQHFDEGPRSIALSPDGKHLAYADKDNQLVVIALPDGRRIATLAGAENAVDDVAFSHDGRWLVAASWDQRAYVWSTTTWEPRAILDEHDHRVVGASFDPNHRWLATASWDGTTRLWSLAALDEHPEAILEELQRDLRLHIEDAQMVSAPDEAQP